MIKSEKSNVMIEGNLVEILADFTFIIKSMREVIAEDEGQKFADYCIKLCGEVAYMTNEERDAEFDRIREKEHKDPMKVLMDLVNGGIGDA